MEGDCFWSIEWSISQLQKSRSDTGATSNSTRNPGLDQKWSTLDQIWTRTGPTLKYFFEISDQVFFAQNSILVNYQRSWKNILRILIPSCIFRLDQKWSRVDHFWSRVDHFWSNPGFLVLINYYCLSIVYPLSMKPNL